ncbi:hypothetical protein [Sporisorium scitamineum]|uniref:Uncharacterized protein n=1 Tax=Sporisorium scitamineum TaxID=49012 RepID=A0A0F7SCD0_9BASI|nr:hypothetical protein [Sporisorium scitamineum]
MNTLKHYSSYLSIRNKSNPDKRIHHKHSFASFLTTSRSTTGSSSSTDLSPTTSADDTLSSTTPSLTLEPSPNQPAFTPPPSTSYFQWHFHRSLRTPAKLWWRNVDSMANFILHWQTRFHQHGDMFGSFTLNVLPSPSSSRAVACELTVQQLREAVRRLRFDHPTVALRLAKRGSVGIEPLGNIPELIADHVDLHVALVYEVVESEVEVEEWLDEVVVLHEEDRLEDDEEFRAFLSAATADGVPGRDRLRIYYWPASGDQDARLLIEQCHSVSEGIGTLHVFDLLLSAISSVLSSPTPLPFTWGEEVTRLEPAVQDAIANPPDEWTVSTAERKRVKKLNADRMNGKATPPSIVDKVGERVIALTLNGENSTNKMRRNLVNKPLVEVCRSVAGKGDMFPLGLCRKQVDRSPEPAHTRITSQIR